MTAIEKYFFTPIYHPRSAIGVIRWWESRRLLYNASVGAAGVTSLGVMALLGSLPPHPLPFDMGILLIGVPVYGLLANLGFTVGAPADLLLRRFLGERAAAAGPVLFRYGFVFSVGLTLLPIPAAVIDWVLRFLR
jgi:hypothetical protein